MGGGVRGCLCAGGWDSFKNAMIKNVKIQDLRVSTRPRISTPLCQEWTESPDHRDLGAAWGRLPHPRAGASSSAAKTRSGHSRFLHGLPPLATGVGDVGAAAVHGARAPATAPRARTQTARAAGPAAAGTTAAGAGSHEAALTLPASSARWENAAPSEPRPPQPRASRCAARAWRRRWGRAATGGDR